MARKPKHTGGIYTFLEASGVLQTNDDALIKQAKRTYWTEYKRKWRLSKRRSGKEFTIFLDGDDLQLIASATKSHVRKLPDFFKAAVLAYITRQYIVPDRMTVNHIRELLSLNYTALQAIADGNKIHWNLSRQLLKQLEALEKQVLEYLQNPKLYDSQKP